MTQKSLTLPSLTLEDKYAVESGRVYLTGTQALVRDVLRILTRDNHALAVEIASLPSDMRGYGPVKEASVAKARERLSELIRSYRNGGVTAIAAE